MKVSGAYLARFALEQIGVERTFGIPGVHNTELYDELNKSEQIEPTLVTHELGAAFMADGVSRTQESIGTLVIVPAAGTTHAMSGIGEAFLDGVPMLVISGGVRRDSGKSYQLHQIEQGPLVQGITKKYFLIQNHNEIIKTIYEAYDIAISGEPGPVFVEIPSNLLLFTGEVSELTTYKKSFSNPKISSETIKQFVDEIQNSKNPGLYVGWGACHASKELIELAELLQAPVATTMQGISAFPANHPLHAGMGIGPSAIPAAQEAFKTVDLLLTIGARFGELATGSYGFKMDYPMLHIDINKEVFNKNYPAKLTLNADSKEAIMAIIEEIKKRQSKPIPARKDLTEMIKRKKEEYYMEWEKADQANLVNPFRFFKSLRKILKDDGIVFLDDGNHTFLAAELFPSHASKCMISPTDFNAMGYCVPAAIGAKLTSPQKQVVGIVGDGGFLMTGLELLTATSLNAGVIIFVFHDGELGQISQFQQIPLNRKTCTVLSDIKIEGVAIATGAHFLSINNNQEIDSVMNEAFKISANGKPVLVDVKIDYSKKTIFTKGAVSVNLARFPLGEKVRFIGRALKRHILG